MMTRSLFLLAMVVLASLGGVASAQVTSGRVHAGVPLTAVVPAGMTVLDVRAPDQAGAPARIRLATSGSARPAALLDVWVTPSSAAAASVFDQQALTISSRVLADRSDVGDRARAEVMSGPAGLVLAVRHNVTFAVRAIEDQCDAALVAAHVDAAISAAPLGSTTAEAGFQRAEREGVLELSAMASTLDLTVRALGEVHARRTDRGWRIARGAPAEIFWVDAQLRIGHARLD